jgi:hypothetical protein
MLLCRLNIPEDEIISGYPNTPTDENDDFHEKRQSELITKSLNYQARANII